MCAYNKKNRPAFAERPSTREVEDLLFFAFEEVRRVWIPACVVEASQHLHALAKRSGIAAVGSPLHLAYRGQSRQQHPLQMIEVGDIFCPHIALYAEDMPLLVRFELVVWVERIYLFDGHVAAYGKRLADALARLVAVEVAVRAGCHDDVVAALGSRYAAFGAAPRHDVGRLRYAAAEDLVPAYHLATVRHNPASRLRRPAHAR